MIDDNTELERQYRKHLMIVSMVVLIYSIAGGAFDNDISFSGAKLSFSRPQWIEYFMIVVMLFLQWRHWQVSGSIRRRHRCEVLNSLLIPSWVIRYLKYVFNPSVTFQGVDNYGYAIMRDGEKIGRIKVEVVDVFFTFILIKAIGVANHYEQGELSYFGLTNSATRGDGSPHILTSREIRVVQAKYNGDTLGFISVRYVKIIPFIMLNMFYRIRWIALSYKEVWFGDSLLPAFVTASALISYLLSKSIG
ncbi:hypothetical protein [Aeromonas caviae]|uniref:hypothetical protein n=1 Tax=Aeromonas caviae TaxID=648 RepID=UPI003F7439A0